jgi:hypothetical protein
MKNAKLSFLALLFAALAVFAPSACASTATVVAGQSVTVFVKSVSGTNAGMTFQWSKDGAVIPGATGVALPGGAVGVAGSAYTMSTVATTDAGGYSCKITNQAGSTVTDTATISFIVAPSGGITGVVVNGVLQP